MIEPHAFLPEQPGQINPVKKSDDAGEQPGGSQYDGSHDQRMPGLEPETGLGGERHVFLPVNLVFFNLYCRIVFAMRSSLGSAVGAFRGILM